ncbi:enoyl-CoA hydratase/isomerase family protein [Nitriliruptoraceae bacterium ZYF776]|nr:enoyl-CoA hydratase/isomerase family protein [Profundirhabdus halotolerans]
MPVLLDRRDDGVVVLTLDDPDRRNAMTEAMGDDLRDACDALRDDPHVRAVVLTGTPPAFSAGGDLAMLQELGRRTREEGFDATETMRGFYARFLAVRQLPQPVVAAINGHAVGAGLCVALACDLRIVASEAKVGLNFSQLGLHPGMGGSWLLPRAIGDQRAALWLYTGRLVSGDEAAAAGMALEARPAADVLPAALEVAAEIAAASPVTVRQLKATLLDPADDLDTALGREAAAQAVGYGTDDLAEGLAAAVERRAPTFPGR